MTDRLRPVDWRRQATPIDGANPIIERKENQMTRIDVLIQFKGEDPMQVVFEDDTGYDEADEDDDVFWYGSPVESYEYNSDGWRVLDVIDND